MQEFAIIDKFFKNFNQNIDSNLTLGIGDDCAILSLNKAQDLLITSDTLVLGTHFLDSAPINSIGHKSLAVNLSDIAAMGGVPKWFTLALTMPEPNIEWLTEFTSGLRNLAHQFNVHLIGGDLTRGPLSITITALGLKGDRVLTRQSAKVSDGIFVTGSLGLPSYILEKLLQKKQVSDPHLINSTDNKLYYPKPRVKTGQIIAQYATSAIDISDGLLADLVHITKQSKVSADILLSQCPVSDYLLVAKQKNQLDQQQINKFVLNGGDEYELLFTAPMEYKDILVNNKDCNISWIGVIKDVSQPINIIDQDNCVTSINHWIGGGWQHFN